MRFREGFMLEMLMQWYRRRFSDPEAIALLVILLAGFGIMFFFSGLLAPLLVAIVLAYLLEWPTVRLEYRLVANLGHLAGAGAICRYLAVNGLCGDAGGLATGHLSHPRYAWYAQ